jgi:hypothetical protein
MRTTWGGVAALLAALTAGACNQAASSGGDETDASAPTIDLAGARQTASGSFTGASGHETTGTASVYATEAGIVIALGEDFSLDGAPDPVVGLGDAGTYDAASKMGPLLSDTGAQTYLLPAGVDIGDYLQVYIWCEEFAVPLGVADLTLL